MTLEEIINRLDYLMRKEHAKNSMLPDGFPLEKEVVENENALHEAIALLKTHPDAQPNEPLTLEELRGMEGWPVWTVTKGISDYGRWEIVIDAECEDRLEMVDGADGFYEIDTDSYGKTWLAYRRPPKED